jgi:hypothetical protein
MPQTRFCSKCGASLATGADHCALCRTPVAAFAAEVGGGSASPAGNPWLSMWLHPRVTIRTILNHDATHLVLPIAAVGGISQALNRLAQKNAADSLSFPVILLIACVVGPLGGIVSLYFMAAVLRVAGRWIGGQASAEQIRASIAWGAVPALWGAMLWVPAIGLTGGALFSSERPGTLSAGVLLAGSLMIVQLVTAVWGFFTGLHSLGETQGFSAWKAFGNVMLAAAIVLGPLALLVAVAVAVVPR